MMASLIKGGLVSEVCLVFDYVLTVDAEFSNGDRSKLRHGKKDFLRQ